MASDRLSVRIPKTLQRELEEVVEATGKNEADIVRDALEEYCLKHAKLPSAYDLAKAAGHVGCVKGGAKDRSTNPKYLNGFGRE